MVGRLGSKSTFSVTCVTCRLQDHEESQVPGFTARTDRTAETKAVHHWNGQVAASFPYSLVSGKAWEWDYKLIVERSRSTHVTWCFNPCLFCSQDIEKKAISKSGKLAPPKEPPKEPPGRSVICIYACKYKWHSVHCEKHLHHKILISKAFYFRSCSKVAVNFCFPKATNKHFTYVYHWTLKPAAVTFHGVRLLCCEKRFNVPHDRNVAGNFPILWLITSCCQSCELLDPPWGKTNLLPWWWLSTEDQCLKVSSSCYVSWCL